MVKHEKYGYKLITAWVLRLVILELEIDTLMSGQGEFYQKGGYSAHEFKTEEEITDYIVSRKGRLTVFDINHKEHEVSLRECVFIPQKAYFNNIG